MRTCANHLASDKHGLESTRSPETVGRAANPKQNGDVGQQPSIFVRKRTPNMDEQGDGIEALRVNNQEESHLLFCHLGITFKFLLENPMRLCASQYR